MTLRTGAGLVALALAAIAQRGRVEFESAAPAEFAASAEYRFVRLEYTDLPHVRRRFGYSSRGGTGAGWWMMDWPDAERHFTAGLQRLTRIAAGEPVHFRLLDDRLFDHPWIYATQVGWWDLSDAEVARLREYLRRGGFLVVDDFWGLDQWETFRRTLERVAPGEAIVDIPDGDSVLHVLYDLPEKARTFIPGSRHLRRGPGGALVIHQPEGTVPAWRAMYDARGRVSVAVNYTMDVADAWEFADWPEYPEAKTTLAYRYGINTVLYAMTH